MFAKLHERVCLLGQTLIKRCIRKRLNQMIMPFAFVRINCNPLIIRLGYAIFVLEKIDIEGMECYAIIVIRCFCCFSVYIVSQF